MSARHKRMKKRVRDLNALLLRAADHIDSAADVIADSLGCDDLDGEVDAERGFAEMIRRTVTS